MTKDELIQNPQGLRPHVVLLGAGASLAAFPNGDRNTKSLPIMNNLIKVLELEDLFKMYSIPTSGNFEDIYSNITNPALKKELESKIFDYFCDLALPDEVTDYDRLLLALRNKDAIFTFNWDPFLFDAYLRNWKVASLPKIFFLHGNVRIGSCDECEKFGRIYSDCDCGKTNQPVPLLYPIKNKHYDNTCIYTKNSWEEAKKWFSDAFTITIFGYGAPDSDIKAVELIKNGWFDKSARSMEHIEVIDIAGEEVLQERWGSFTPTHHYAYHTNFRDSRLWNWPRRSCESLLYQMSQGIPCENFPIIDSNEFTELNSFIQNISQHE